MEDKSDIIHRDFSLRKRIVKVVNPDTKIKERKKKENEQCKL
jgi:hypothetical protein